MCVYRASHLRFLSLDCVFQEFVLLFLSLSLFEMIRLLEMRDGKEGIKT